MELGISIDAQDGTKAIPLLDHWSDMLHHVQFYLNANLSLEDVHNIHAAVDSFKTHFSYSFHAYGYLNPAEENHQVRAAWIEVGKESINFLSDIGGKFINFHIGYTLSSSCSREKMLFNALESITTLCEYAASKRINICQVNKIFHNHIPFIV